MDFSALQRGEMDALAAFIERHVDFVWTLARRGFVFSEDDQQVWVAGTSQASRLFELTTAVLAETLQPTRRNAITGDEDAARLLLGVARRRLAAAAQPEGRALTLEAGSTPSLPTWVIDLDAATEGEFPKIPAAAPEDLAPETRAQFETMSSQLGEITSHLAPNDATLLEQRLRRAEPRAKVAASLSQSLPAVKEGERRLVRHLLHHLRRTAHAGSRFTVDDLELLIQGDPLRGELPARTRARISADVQKRTFQEEPRPFASRALLAGATLGLSLGLYALMFFGILPGPGDDPVPRADVNLSCAPRCGSDMSMNVVVTAPPRTRRLALWLRNGKGEIRPLLSETAGRPFALPLGAEARPTMIAENVHFPKDPGPGPYEVVAVFSENRPSLASLEAHVDGSRLLPRVVTYTSSVGP